MDLYGKPWAGILMYLLCRIADYSAESYNDGGFDGGGWT
jgi:hypothetical protein